MANTNDVSAAEQKAIDDLKSRITDVIDEMGEFHRHDLSLLRFLKARDLNIDKAELMLRNNIKWRKENRIEELLHRKPDESFVERFPFLVPGYDFQGSYISIIPVGKYDYRRVVENKEKEEFTQHLLMTSELAYELLKYKCTNERYVQAAVMIMDYENFSIRQITSMETLQFMKEITILLEENYPELLKTAYVINTPKFFEVLYTMMKPLLSKAMLEKIKIYSTGSAASWKAELLKHVSPDCLPSQYGGSNTTCFYYRFEHGLDVEPKLVTLPEKDMKTEIVPAGQKLQVDVIVQKAGSQLHWNFKTDAYDIGFHVHFRTSNDAVDNNNEGEPEVIVSCPRCDSHVHTQKGTITCAKAGKYTLVWDNSFSTFRAKTLRYVYQN